MSGNLVNIPGKRLDLNSRKEVYMLSMKMETNALVKVV